MDFRKRVNKENIWRLNQFRRLFIFRKQHQEIWNSIDQEWIKLWNKENLECDIFGGEIHCIGPELIWVGKNYGSKIKFSHYTEFPSNIAFIGYNPRYGCGHAMGYRYSLCLLRNLNPWDFLLEFEEMTSHEWKQFRNGEMIKIGNNFYKFTGYKDFLHVERPYCYASVLNLFFQKDYNNKKIQNMTNDELSKFVYEKIHEEITIKQKKDIIDFIGITNAYIYPGPCNMENPNEKLKEWQILSDVFQGSLHALLPRYLFIFKDLVWNENRLWSSMEIEDLNTNYLWIERIKNIDGKDLECKCMLIPHLSWASTKNMTKQLAICLKEFINKGWNKV